MMKNLEKRKNNIEFFFIFIPLVALIAPFLVFIIEQPLPYPYIIEELVKAFFTYIILQKNASQIKKIGVAVLTAFLFSLSETILYSFNLFGLSTVSIIFQRLVFTSLMHVTTIVIMTAIGSINKKLLPLGVVLGGIIHYFYNYLVGY